MIIQGDQVVLTVTFDRNSILYNEQEIGLFFCRDLYNARYVMAEVAILWKDAMKAAGLEWRQLSHLREVVFDIRFSRFAFPSDQRAQAKLLKNCILSDGDFEQSQNLIIVEHAQFHWRGEQHNVRADFAGTSDAEDYGSTEGWDSAGEGDLLYT